MPGCNAHSLPRAQSAFCAREWPAIAGQRVACAVHAHLPQRLRQCIASSRGTIRTPQQSHCRRAGTVDFRPEPPAALQAASGLRRLCSSVADVLRHGIPLGVAGGQRAACRRACGDSWCEEERRVERNRQPSGMGGVQKGVIELCRSLRSRQRIASRCQRYWAQCTHSRLFAQRTASRHPRHPPRPPPHATTHVTSSQAVSLVADRESKRRHTLRLMGIPTSHYLAGLVSA